MHFINVLLTYLLIRSLVYAYTPVFIQHFITTQKYIKFSRRNTETMCSQTMSRTHRIDEGAAFVWCLLTYSIIEFWVQFLSAKVKELRPLSITYRVSMHMRLLTCNNGTTNCNILCVSNNINQVDTNYSLITFLAVWSVDLSCLVTKIFKNILNEFSDD